MKLQFPHKDIVALAVVSALALLANMPQGWGNWLVSRNTLLAALAAVVVIALFHYLEAFLLMAITTLAVGANLPAHLAESLAISQNAMLIALAVLIGITLLNRKFGFLPVYASPEDEFDPEDTVIIDLAGPHERMMEAIAHGRIALIRQMIAEDSGAISFAVNGVTPLHVAAERGYSAIVQLLIDAGADLLAQNRDGDTPLDIALSQRKHAKTTDILYKATVPLLAPGRG